jgi:hypothetical protein
VHTIVNMKKYNCIRLDVVCSELRFCVLVSSNSTNPTKTCMSTQIDIMTHLFYYIVDKNKKDTDIVDINTNIIDVDSNHVCACDQTKTPYTRKVKYSTESYPRSNLTLEICDYCSDYIFRINVHKEDVTQSVILHCEDRYGDYYDDKNNLTRKVRIKGCKKLLSFVIFDKVSYYFCEKCKVSGPAFYKPDLKLDRILPMHSKTIMCKKCKTFCVRKQINDTTYYFCEKCQIYKGYVKKYVDKQKTDARYRYVKSRPEKGKLIANKIEREIYEKTRSKLDKNEKKSSCTMFNDVYFISKS